MKEILIESYHPHTIKTMQFFYGIQLMRVLSIYIEQEDYWEDLCGIGQQLVAIEKGWA